MTAMASEAQVRLADAGRYIADLCEHFLEHDIPVLHEPGRGRVEFDVGTGTLVAAEGLLALKAEATDETSLAVVKFMLASHLQELPGATDASIVWTGDGCADDTIPSLREVTVRHVVDLTPHMRRITFAGTDLARYDAFDMHVHVIIPPEGHAPQWPVPGIDGIPVWPQGEGAPSMRTYTIRRIDVAAGEIDIDFVMHHDAGPGASFAKRAKVGDVVGLLGPGGRSAGAAEWYCLAADETGLPAIGRILGRLPGHVGGVAVIEVDGPADEQALDRPDGVELRWLHRNGAPPGTTTLLADAVRAIPFPQDRTVFAWAGSEFDAFKALRTHWRKTCGLTRDQHLAVAYWRRGADEDAKDED
ncbi:Vibriobactin utilization protein ViuB [Methylobacterium bullatum]|uniref:Vibriobactin utilization protein ViuB n=1 Tax=Methylobacterium bullatum TaxID=570505 RepID=A0A679J4H9_9HYPH|nr:Vibriobactin utilization protein ViuB [Methylobacterium bullatum]